MQTTPAYAPSISQQPGCAVLHEMGWDFYERFLAETENQRVTHSFVDGELTIMSPIGFPHEHSKHLIARLVIALTEELEVPVIGVGSLTLKSAEKLKGAEPDDGYFLANESAMRGKRDYDPTRDPPPDLLIEIDVSRPSLNRLPVYAALGVPEVWVYDGSSITVMRLRHEETYEPAENSLAFPSLPMREFAAWVEKAYETDETSWIRSFREWVRGSVGPRDS
ncbi:MAG: Uma2 family endonuclease [Planctomycetaceae bacterium]